MVYLQEELTDETFRIVTETSSVSYQLIFIVLVVASEPAIRNYNYGYSYKLFNKCSC